MALAVAVGRGVAGGAALVAGGWRSADPGQTRTLCGALLWLFGLRFAVFLTAEDRRHVVEGKDLCSKQTHLHTDPFLIKLKLSYDIVTPKY